MNAALLLSGGTGSRLNADIPKQYIRVSNKMLITYSLETLMAHPDIHAVLVVAAQEWREIILEDVKLTRQHMGKIKGFVSPGATRQFSILNGLNEIKYHWTDKVDYILIHDAARPNLSSEMISQCMDALKEHDGVMPVLPMKDTVYMCEKDSSAIMSLDRNRLFAGQAPEGFRFDAYFEANRALLPDKLSSVNGSTEPAVMAGMDIVMIPGDENNFKITTKADLVRFCALMLEK